MEVTGPFEEGFPTRDIEVVLLAGFDGVGEVQHSLALAEQFGIVPDHPLFFGHRRTMSRSLGRGIRRWARKVQRLLHHIRKIGVVETLGQDLESIAASRGLAAPSDHEIVAVRVLPEAGGFSLSAATVSWRIDTWP